MALLVLGSPSRAEDENAPASNIEAIVDSIDRRLGELAAEQRVLERTRSALVD
jgi:hypothetical protein